MRIKQTAMMAVLVVSLAAMSAAVACESEAVSASPVTEVSLDKEEVSVVAGEHFGLTATVFPSEADNKDVTWSSSDPSVASVSDGTVFAVKEGTATITVKTVDGGFTAFCVVNVTVTWVAVTGVLLDKTDITCSIGSVISIEPTISPDNASSKEVDWSTSDQSVVSFSETGGFKALKPGIAIITATTHDAGKTATCIVRVAGPVTGVALDKTDVALAKGSTSQITAIVSPETAINKTVVWSSSDPSVATVSSNGRVTAVNIGTAVITARTADGGKTALCDVAVPGPVIGLDLDKTSISLAIEGTSQITATVIPGNAINRDVTWTSSNIEVAAVDSHGMVTAMSGGNATITATTNDGNKTATCSVTVSASGAEGTLDPDSENGGMMYVGILAAAVIVIFAAAAAMFLLPKGKI
ncbi:MAG: Ig-like domain-containing protein [Candidatus Methanoplasma sp.]|jgi:uncharacterized protein YjdB|nr:Ig-like domain-containing protein [Candidatus Methanoplasma sp.]